jgi:hypothetical protein
MDENELIDEIVAHVFPEEPWKSSGPDAIRGIARTLLRKGLTHEEALEVITGVAETVREEYGG